MKEMDTNEYGVLIAKKSEKLVTALYLVTDLITDSEPIKISLRSTAIRLLASMTTLAQPEVKDRITEYKISLHAVTEILSLLHVARTTGIVSQMNGTLLTDGFRSLQLVLEKKQPVLTENMLTIENEVALQANESSLPSLGSSSYDALTPLSLSKPPHSEIKDNSTARETQGDKGQSVQVKETVKVETPIKSISLPARMPSALSSFQQRKVSRRDQILHLFVKGVDVSIKDIALRIKGCSEKTIQRELNALVYDNLIVRIGEKRWSRYMLR
jgi:hypothetical protein